MSLRLAPLSNTEREAVVASLASGVRLDGRGLLENRDVAIQFGKDYGTCTLSLGETRILAKVTCEVVEPRPSRPNEGKIVTSVHITPMAGPEFEGGRTSDAQDELQQLLDSNIKESRCLDLEALCIMAEESVWLLRVDITVLNNRGNLGDACNMAAVAALKHFHRPDVTVEEDGRVTVHSAAERAPIPTHLKKLPVCLTYAFCAGDDAEPIVFSDPTDLEERAVRGRLVVGLNPHGEITSMNFPGLVPLSARHIRFCISNAFQRALQVAGVVDRAVARDLEARAAGQGGRGFVEGMVSDEALQRSLIEDKLSAVTSMAAKIRSVREMMDAHSLQEEEEGRLLKEESESDSEFSDSDVKLPAPCPSKTAASATAVPSSRRDNQDSGGGSDSEEDTKETMDVAIL